MGGPAVACAVAEEHSDGAGGKAGRGRNLASKVRRRPPGVAAVDGAVQIPGREPESCPSDLRKNDGAGMDAVGISAYGPSSASVWPLELTAWGVAGGWDVYAVSSQEKRQLLELVHRTMTQECSKTVSHGAQ